MLIVRKNLTNNLIATVSMNKTLPNPYYLFSFQHIASKDRISFIPQVITSNVRYDKFRFVESPTTNLSLTPPQVHFEYLGQYYYSIYEQLSPTNTNIDLTYNKLESGRAWVIVGDDNTEECFFEPYISNDEDFAQIIYVSEEEEACQNPITPSQTPSNTPTPSITPSITPSPTLSPTNTPTPSITPSITPSPTVSPTNTATPTRTPTNTPTPSSTPSGVLQFFVASGSTHSIACAGSSSFYVYAQDLGNCGGCLPGYCWPCLTTAQQVFLDSALTIPVPDGYYRAQISFANAATWYIIGGYPQPAGFVSC